MAPQFKFLGISGFLISQLTKSFIRPMVTLMTGWFRTGMHGRGPKAGVPVSDTAGRGRPCVRAATDRVVPRGKSRIGPTRLKSAPIRRKSAPTRPKSGRLGPYRPYRPVSAETAKTAESGRNLKKKKKKVQTHRFTNLKTPRPLTFRPTLSNSLSHSVPHLPSLCHCAPSLIYLLCVSGSLCECSVLLQPSGVLSLLFS